MGGGECRRQRSEFEDEETHLGVIWRQPWFLASVVAFRVHLRTPAFINNFPGGF
jgi:hypothetical protein